MFPRKTGRITIVFQPVSALINDDEKLLENSLTVPDAALADSDPHDLALEGLLSKGRVRACETRSHLSRGG